MENDESLIALLDRDPERGMALLIEEYSGLLWTVCCQYLPDSEDVKECVNETFFEFYLHRERFDPEKGTLKGYLAVIARRCALRRMEANRKWEEASSIEPKTQSDPFAHMENSDELEAALSELTPIDETIIRMKYYGGMTVKEIAESLKLPYETVKKRHQRSLKKMLRSLSIGLVILAVLALLAACAYVVLRHFGFVPGYGINTNADAAVYVLENGTVIQGEKYEFHLEDAYWRDGTFMVDLKLYGESNYPQTSPKISLRGLDNARSISLSHGGNSESGQFSYRIIYEGDLPDNVNETLNLTLTIDGKSIPVKLQKADETSLDQVGFYALTEKDGGLLAIPRIENGELVVSIHPLNEGDFNTYFFLNEGPWKGYGGPHLPITVTAPDGTVLKGEPAAYSPFSGDTYMDWYFGPAQPGKYTLNVPYVYQAPAADAQPPAVQVDLNGDNSGAVLALPGGKLKLGGLTSIDKVTDYCDTVSDAYNTVGYRWWTLETMWEGEDPERVPAAIPVLAENTGYTVVDGVSYHNTEAKLWTKTVADSGSGGQYTLSPGYVLGAMKGQDSVGFSVQTKNIFYRWNHPFTIQMTVNPEQKREEFTASAGEYSVFATPRRVNGKVMLSLRPVASHEHIVPSGNLVHSPLSTMGVKDDPITLTAADGTEYQGSFLPGRKEDYSDWDFGDIPAGTYTLHIPYLYTTVKGEYHTAIPLPQQKGETLPVGSVELAYNASVALDSITGMGQDTNSPAAASPLVISYPFGGITETEATPLTSLLSVSLQSKKAEYTLVDVGLRLHMTEESYFTGACERQYAFEKTGPRLTGLLLRHAPKLYATDLTFTNPTYRWNHAFDISVTIPE